MAAAQQDVPLVGREFIVTNHPLLTSLQSSGFSSVTQANGDPFVTRIVANARMEMPVTQKMDLAVVVVSLATTLHYVKTGVQLGNMETDAL
jgi:hypothetical protein